MVILGYSCVAAAEPARPRPLAGPVVPPPPLVAPRVEFPPPGSLIPRLRLEVERLPLLVEVVRPALSSLLSNELPEPKLSVHSPICSLMFDNWLLICERFDHRNSPAAAAPAATAAAAIGLSRAISMTPPVLSLPRLPELLLRLRPPRVFLAICYLLGMSLLSPYQRLKALHVRRANGSERRGVALRR